MVHAKAKISTIMVELRKIPSIASFSAVTISSAVLAVSCVSLAGTKVRIDWMMIPKITEIIDAGV